VREIAEKVPEALSLCALTPNDIAEKIFTVLDKSEQRARQSKAARGLIDELYAAKRLYSDKVRFLESIVSV